MERPHVTFGKEPVKVLVPVGGPVHDYFTGGLQDYLGYDEKSRQLWRESCGVAGKLEDAILLAELSPGQRKAMVELSKSSYLSGKKETGGYRLSPLLQGCLPSAGDAGKLSEAVEALYHFGTEVKGTDYNDRNFLWLLEDMETFDYERRQAERQQRMSLSVPAV